VTAGNGLPSGATRLRARRYLWRRVRVN